MAALKRAACFQAIDIRLTVHIWSKIQEIITVIKTTTKMGPLAIFNDEFPH